MTALPGAGSNRRYYRMAAPQPTAAGGNSGNVIGVVGTSEEENRSFCAMTEAFVKRGLNVPKLLAHSEDFMAYIVEDLGDVSLFDSITKGRE